MNPVIIGNATLYCGDCLEIMAGMDSESVDAIVTDPPYGLSFMGKDWDSDVPGAAIWQEALRVLKPGGHLLAFFGTRTYHRGAVEVEKAGFRIVDMIAWVYGSGFPKNKALLKPAMEPIVLAVKKGKRALNIEECRIGMVENDQKGEGGRIDSTKPNKTQGYSGGFVMAVQQKDHLGRWPANLIHDGSEEVLAGFPDNCGGRWGKESGIGERISNNVYQGGWGPRLSSSIPGDVGSAARFFYCAKASPAERDEGLEGMELRARPTMGNGIGTQPNQLIPNNRNHHPTVKPIDLMRWLCRLVTPPGGLVLDCFTGSGTTGIAAYREGFRFVGCEMNPDYFQIACKRIEAAQRQTRLAFDLEAAA